MYIQLDSFYYLYVHSSGLILLSICTFIWIHSSIYMYIKLDSFYYLYVCTFNWIYSAIFTFIWIHSAIFTFIWLHSIFFAIIWFHSIIGTFIWFLLLSIIYTFIWIHDKYLQSPCLQETNYQIEKHFHLIVANLNANMQLLWQCYLKHLGIFTTN